MARWQALTEVPVYPHLVGLAQQPFDLTSPGALASARMLQYCSSAAGFDLLYATQRVNAEVLAGLQELADQCGLVEQFCFVASARKGRFGLVEKEQAGFLIAAREFFFSDQVGKIFGAQQAQRFERRNGAGHVCFAAGGCKTDQPADIGW